jgi:hypothetical protein
MNKTYFTAMMMIALAALASGLHQNSRLQQSKQRRRPRHLESQQCRHGPVTQAE